MLLVLLLTLVDLASMGSPTDAAREMPLQLVFKCAQPASEREPLFREAIENQFTVRRIEFVGNNLTRDNVLRKRILLQEGEVFARRNLLQSIANVSRLGTIYPLRMRDVVVRLDRTEKFIDMIFCFRERHRHR